MEDMTQLVGPNAFLIVITAVLLVIGAILIQRARQDVLGSSEDPGADPLAAYREAYKRGQMDFAEYQRILDTLDRQRRGGPLEVRPVPEQPPGSDGAETPEDDPDRAPEEVSERRSRPDDAPGA